MSLAIQRSLLAQNKPVLVKQGMCDQCYGKPFVDIMKSIVSTDRNNSNIDAIGNNNDKNNRFLP